MIENVAASLFSIFLLIDVYTTLYYTVGIPFFIATVVTLSLHLLGRLFLFSSPRRSRYLFSEVSWLPLRRTVGSLPGEEVEFSSGGNITLRGTFIARTATAKKGTVLFCHELNGNRCGIEPYVENLIDSGFNILAFDFRDHGRSDSSYRGCPTPWVTTADLEDVKAAVKYLSSRSDVGEEGINVFGLGKGATIALCLAGCDSRVRSVVLDAPMAEKRLFDKNCWQSLLKSTKLSRRQSSKFFSLLIRAVLYSVACPFLSIALAWRRFMLGFWFDCRFVNPWPLVKNVRQPIMIVHGHVDSTTRADQIQAFCDRMPIRPRLWLVSAKDRKEEGAVYRDCSRQVVRFFEEATT